MSLDGLADLHGELRLLLNVWGPISVADVVDDEYDCLIGPITAKLAGGSTSAEMSEFIWLEITDHFGLDPESCGADAFGARLAIWFSAKSANRSG